MFHEIGIVRAISVLVLVAFLGLITVGCGLPLVATSKLDLPEYLEINYLENSLNIEIIEINEQHAIVQISGIDLAPLMVEFRYITISRPFEQTQILVNDQEVSLTSLIALEDRLSPQEQLQAHPQGVGTIILLAWSAIEFLRNCAIPVYNDWTNKGTITENTAIACAIEAASALVSKLVAKGAVSAIKVTALREAIKSSILGKVITWRQLQQLINKGTKREIAAIIGELASMFFKGTVNVLRKVFDEFGIIHQSGAKPVVKGISLQGKSLKVGVKYLERVYFSDEDGDLASIKFEHRTGWWWKESSSWTFKDQIGIYNGSIIFTIICYVPGTIRERVTLTDLGGLSNSLEYVYYCVKQ
jgi:hypothetical protein